MSVVQYKGSRYLPILGRKDDDTIEWDSSKEYEPLTIVTHSGGSYTSRQYVPVGVDIEDEYYWGFTGNYNAQVEQYRNDVKSLKNKVKDYFYPEIVFDGIHNDSEERTDYYITRVPLRDSAGHVIQPTMVWHPGENPLQNAGRIGSTLSINGTCSIKLTDNSYVQGTTIGNGVVLNEHSFADDDTVSELVYELYLCFDRERNLHEIPVNTNPTAQNLLSQGFYNVFPCYAKLTCNGSVKPLSAFDPPLEINGTTVTETLRNPLTMMGVDADNTLFFFACDGRTLLNLGFHYQAAVQKLIDLGCRDVYLLDGGGSTCMVYRGSKVNRNIENQGTTIRRIECSIAFTKQSENNSEITSFENTGFERQLLMRQLVSYINQNAFAARSLHTVHSGDSLQDFTTPGKFGCRTSAIAATIEDSPFPGQTFDLYVMQFGSLNHLVLQIAVSTVYRNGVYQDRMAMRFVDNELGETSSISPYVSDWTYLCANPPLKIALVGGDSITIPYRVNRPVWNFTYRIGTGSAGVVIIEYDSYYVVSSKGPAVDSYLNIAFDDTNHTITITNNGGAHLYGVLTEGYWNGA